MIVNNKWLHLYCIVLISKRSHTDGSNQSHNVRVCSGFECNFWLNVSDGSTCSKAFAPSDGGSVSKSLSLTSFQQRWYKQKGKRKHITKQPEDTV